MKRVARRVDRSAGGEAKSMHRRRMQRARHALRRAMRYESPTSEYILPYFTATSFLLFLSCFLSFSLSHVENTQTQTQTRARTHTHKWKGRRRARAGVVCCFGPVEAIDAQSCMQRVGEFHCRLFQIQKDIFFHKK